MGEGAIHNDGQAQDFVSMGDWLNGLNEWGVRKSGTAEGNERVLYCGGGAERRHRFYGRPTLPKSGVALRFPPHYKGRSAPI
jgi:hypothetical protein